MVQLTLNQRFALLDLYKNEIKKHLEALYTLSNREELGGAIAALLPSGELARLSDSCLDVAAFSNELWDALHSSPLAIHLYDTLLNYIRLVDPRGELHSLLCAVSEGDRRSQFRDVLIHYEQYMHCIDVDKALSVFESIPLYASCTAKLRENLDGDKFKDMSTEDRRRVVLRTLPLMGTDAIYDLMHAVSQCSDEARAFINKKSPYFERFYPHWSSRRHQPQNVVQVVEVADSLADVLAELDLAKREKRSTATTKFAKDLKWEDIPATRTASTVQTLVLHSLDNRICHATPIILRSYQQELCKDALEGRNAIINAPTGSGKTIVAAHIVKTHLEKMQGRGKVLFLIPNTVILEQQKESISRFLDHKYEVVSARGSDGVPLRPLIDSHHVTVTVPQMIVNLIEERPLSEEALAVHREFTICEFSLVVMDECHAAKKDSPYNKLMQHYHRLKFSGKMKRGQTLPQIVGLTASLGVGGAKNIQQAKEHIVKMCANLDCRVVSVVNQHLDTLRKYSPLTPDEVIFVDSPPSSLNCLYGRSLQRLLCDMEKILLEIAGMYGIRVTPPGAPLPPFEGWIGSPPSEKGEGYMNWLAVHRNTVVPELRGLPAEAKRALNHILDVIYEVYRGAELAHDFPSRSVHAALSKKMEQQLRLCEARIQNLWLTYSPQLSRELCGTHPLVEQVIGRITSLISSRPDSRAIVFVRTRQAAEILAHLLDNETHMVTMGVRTECIMGVNGGKSDRDSPDGNGGKGDQAGKLARFAEGKTKVLVATSVAEEGLDIATCNLVIKYNYATNEIAHVQRRGRGRAEGSCCVLVTNSEKRCEQEKLNVARERLMNEAIEQIRRGVFTLDKMVLAEQVLLWQDLQQSDALKEAKKEKRARGGTLYTLECKCGAVLCTSAQMRIHKQSQYTVCAPEFWKKVRCVELDEASKVKEHSEGKIFCTSSLGGRVCNRGIGRVIRVEQASLPVLSAKDFVLVWRESGQEQRKSCKQWKDIVTRYFEPEPIRPYDVTLMNKTTDAPRFSTASLNVDEKEKALFQGGKEF